MTDHMAPSLRIRALRSDLAGPFDLTVPVRGIVVVSGASGSGKSLFLRMLADLDPNVGEVFLGEQARSAFSGPEWRRRVPYLAAESGWWADDVASHFIDDDLVSARSLATRLGVGSAQFDGPVACLSTGERQRLAFVRLLVLGAPVMLLDEPTGPLDPESVAAVEAVLVERASAGTIIIMVSHDPRQAERIATARYVMHDRRLDAVL